MGKHRRGAQIRLENSLYEQLQDLAKKRGYFYGGQPNVSQAARDAIRAGMEAIQEKEARYAER